MLLAGFSVAMLAWNADGLSSSRLITTLTGDTVVARVAIPTPLTVVAVAVIAGALWSTLGVEACFLVERNSVRGMAAAEDISAAATVMTTREEGKCARASWRSAKLGAGIRLPVIPSRCTSYGGRRLIVPLIGHDSGDAALTPWCERSSVVFFGTDRKRSDANELDALPGAVHTAVSAAWWSQGDLSGTGHLGWSQNGRDVQRDLWLAHLTGVQVRSVICWRHSVGWRCGLGRVEVVDWLVVKVRWGMERCWVLSERGCHGEEGEILCRVSD